MDERLEVYEEKMGKTISNLNEELTAIRAGRANPKILDRIKVDYYGTMTPINQMAAISVPEARILQIQPWDMSSVKAIEKAILTSDIGINPNNDGKVIRLVFPELNEERRKELCKEAKKRGEESKIAIRNIRRDAIDSFRKFEDEVSEDLIKDLEDKVQKLTDKFTDEIDRIIEDKEEEIMSV